MYSIDTLTGVINYPDGFRLAPPYYDPRYFEYVSWVNAGNQPEEISGNPLIAATDSTVNPAQARAALYSMGLYDSVLALMAHPETPALVKIKWEFTLSFRRNDDAVIMMAQILGWDSAILDELFSTAALIT